MKKTILFLLILLFNISLVSSLNVNTIEFPSYATAGEPFIIFFQIENDETEKQNVLLEIETNAPYTNNWIYTIFSLAPNQKVNINALMNYTQPGTYNENLKINNQNNYFDAKIKINPEQKEPIIYHIPDIFLKQYHEYELNLNQYVTDINDDTITWSSTNNIVTFNQNIATFYSEEPGTNIVTLIADDGTFQVSKNVNVYVSELPELIISPNINSMFVSETIQLTASEGTSGNYEWTSNDKCSVNNGLVTAITEGECIINVIDVIGLERNSIKIQIKKIPNMRIEPQDETIYVTEKIQLNAIIETNNEKKSETITWSSNEKCLVENGLVTALEIGTCNIKAEDNLSPAYAETNVFVISIPE